MHAFLHAINWKGMTNGELFVICSLFGGIFLIMAWLADVLMERISFGVIWNTIILVAGAVAGLFLLVQTGFAPTQKAYMHAVFACLSTAMAFLVLVASFRRPV